MNKIELAILLADVFDRVGRSCLYISKGMLMDVDEAKESTPERPQGRVPRNPITGEPMDRTRVKPQGEPNSPDAGPIVPLESKDQTPAPTAPQEARSEVRHRGPKVAKKPDGFWMDDLSELTGVTKGGKTQNVRAPTDAELLAAGATLPPRVLDALQKRGIIDENGNLLENDNE